MPAGGVGGGGVRSWFLCGFVVKGKEEGGRRRRRRGEGLRWMRNGWMEGGKEGGIVKTRIVK